MAEEAEGLKRCQKRTQVFLQQIHDDDLTRLFVISLTVLGKPQIQQVSDDSDKQAVINRLRAEVQFLRDQIRLSERTERKKAAPQERAERRVTRDRIGLEGRSRSPERTCGGR